MLFLLYLRVRPYLVKFDVWLYGNGLGFHIIYLKLLPRKGIDISLCIILCEIVYIIKIVLSLQYNTLISTIFNDSICQMISKNVYTFT